MVYIPKSSLSNSLKVKYKPSSSSFLSKPLAHLLKHLFGILLPKAPTPSKYDMLSLLLSLMAFTVLFIPRLKLHLFPYVPALLLPLSLILSTLYEISPLPSSKLQLLHILFNFASNSLGLSLTTLCFIMEIPEKVQINSFILLSSIHSVIFISAWTEYHKGQIYQTMSNFKITEIKFLLSSILIISYLSGQNALASTVAGFSVLNIIITTIAFIAVVIVLIYTAGSFAVGETRAFNNIVPLVLMNTSLYYWITSDLFTNYSIIIYLIHSLNLCLISMKLKVFAATKVVHHWGQPEIICEFLFTLQEIHYKVLPTHPTFLILCVFIVIRYIAFHLSVFRQLKSYLSSH